MKKMISLLVAILLLASSASAFAAYSDVPKGAAYTEALDRVVSLGIMEGMANGQIKPNDAVTREEFARIMVVLAGLEDKADSLAGTSIYKDMDPKSSYSGYVNAAVQKGFVTGMADGKFHPKEGITYAQVCTAMVKVLGYTDQDVPGLWPKNYIEKAKYLQITDGISLSSSDKVSRGSMAQMINSLLDTNMKKNSAQEADKTLAASVNLSNDNLFTVYSRPEIAHGFNPSTNKMGSISFTGNPAIVRNTVDNSTTTAGSKIGESINIYQIKENDVVYQVSDTSKKNRYILVVDNKVTGNITGILPDKHAPKTIQIDGKNYELGKYFNTSKINSTPGSFTIGNSVCLLLGYDGKVEGIVEAGDDDTSQFAFVLNTGSATSTNVEDYGKVTYSVKLLLTNGQKVTYKTNSSFEGLKGKLVTYSVNAYEYATLSEVKNIDLSEFYINKDGRQIGSSDVTSGVKIFNIISYNANTDCDVGLLHWNDLSSGMLPFGKVLYINKAGAFDDVNLIVLRDAFDQQYKQAYVKRVDVIKSGKTTSYSHVLLIDGKEYTYTANSIYFGFGSIINVSMTDGTVNYLLNSINPEVSTSKINAIDSKRIKINNTIYKFKDSIDIYYKDIGGNITLVGTNDVDTSKTFSNVSVYLDKPLSNNGRVVAIVIAE